MFDLSNRTALVSGASGGIGQAIAQALHGQGATVVLSGTRREALDALAAELAERVHVLTCDLSNMAAVGEMPKAAESLLGRGVDILVNNAGITRDNLALRMKEEDWDAVLSVNLKAAFLLSKGVLRGMMKQQWGRIINITSIVGVTGNPGQANYAAAKAGLIGMTKSLAQEVASRHITINCLAPGFIATPMTDVLNEEQKDNLITRVPLGRLGTPEDVASGVVYLASDEAGYITGQTLHINGGMAMI